MTAGLLWSANANEMHPGAGSLGDVGHESQPTGGQGRSEDLWQVRFLNRWLSRGQLLDLVGVNVDAHDLKSKLGHRRGVDGSEVATTDN